MLPRLLIAASCLALGTAPGAQAAERIPELVFGDPGSEAAHQLTATGAVVAGTLVGELGDLPQRHRVRTLDGADAALGFTVQVGAGPQPVLLEVQEVHHRRPQVFGYVVRVNGTEVYFRTYAELACGPCHYFIAVPRALAPDGRLRVEFVNRGAAPFSLGRVWAYGDFAALAAQDGTWRPMPVLGRATALLGMNGPKGKADIEQQHGTYAPAELDRAWSAVTSRYAESTGQRFTPGYMTTCSYPADNLTARRIQEVAATELEFSARHGLTWQFNFNGGEWGGHPCGADGLGGNFYDLRYSQACYDPVTRAWTATFPGGFGNTLMPTRNQDNLRLFLLTRAGRAARLLAQEHAFLSLDGTPPPTWLVTHPEGPTYWDNGDFSVAAVAAAAAAGVRLDPRDGLDEAERKWLFDNQTRFTSAFCATVRSALGKDPVVVRDGQAILPRDQLGDHLLSHPFYNPDIPYFDERRANWQTGVNPDAYNSGEPLEYVHPGFFDTVRSIGRLTCANLVRDALHDYGYLVRLYQRGFQTVSIYCLRSGDLDAVMQPAQGLDDLPGEPVQTHRRALLDLRFGRDGGLGGPDQLVRAVNLGLEPGFTWRHRPSAVLDDPARPGELLYRFAHQRPLPAGVQARLDFGGASYAGGRDNGNLVEVWAGTDAATLRQVAATTYAKLDRTSHWPHTRTLTVDLGAAVGGATSGFLRVVITAVRAKPDPDPRLLANTFLRQVEVTLPWERAAGQLVGDPATTRDQRTRNLWIQDRAVALRLRDRFLAAGGEVGIAAQAEELIAVGRSRAAFQLLAGEYSHLLPATFAVQGHGPLGRHPLAVALADDRHRLLVHLLESNPNSARLELVTREPQDCTLRFSGLVPGRYALVAEGGNRFALASRTDGSLVADAQGRLETLVAVVPPPIPGDPGWLAASTGRIPGRRLVAMALGKDLYESQDPGLWLDNPLLIRSATGAALVRRRDGEATGAATAPAPGDRVEITLDDRGDAVRLDAQHGETVGVIRAFIPPSVHPAPLNGTIELEDGSRFDLTYRGHRSTRFAVDGLAADARANEFDLYRRVLVPGLRVRIQWSPSLVDGVAPRALAVHQDPKPAAKRP